MTIEEVKEIRTRFGSVRIVAAGHILLAIPRGYMGARTLLRGLQEAETFAFGHKSGWWHVTDTSGVRFVNPLNPFLLRRVQRLPNINGYVVVAPSRLLRFALRVVRPLLRQDVVVTSQDEALRWVALQERR